MESPTNWQLDISFVNDNNSCEIGRIKGNWRTRKGRGGTGAGSSVSFSTYKIVIPVESGTAGKVAAKFDHISTRKYFQCQATHEPTMAIFIIAIDPLLILFSQIDWAIEFASPLEVRAVEMGVRDGNRLQPASGLDKRNGVRVQQADAVPQDVSCFRFDQDGALANSKLRAGEDGPNATVDVVLLDFVGVA